MRAHRLPAGERTYTTGMDTRKLSHFLAVAEHGSFTKAGEALFIAQPSLSQSIRGLEHEVGGPLFRRLPRSLELTAAGEALLGPARRALRALQDASEAVRAVSTLQTGNVDITAPRSLVTHPTVDIVTAFRLKYPKVSITIIESIDSAEAAERVRDGFAECGVLELSGSAKGLKTTHLFDYELYVVFPPGTPNLTGAQAISGEELAGRDLVAFPPGTVSRQLLDKLELDAQVSVEVRSASALIALVVQGVGAAVMIETHAREAAAQGAVAVPLRPAVRRRVGIALSSGESAPAAKEFARIAVTMFSAETAM